MIYALYTRTREDDAGREVIIETLRTLNARGDIQAEAAQIYAALGAFEGHLLAVEFGRATTINLDARAIAAAHAEIGRQAQQTTLVRLRREAGRLDELAALAAAERDAVVAKQRAVDAEQVELEAAAAELEEARGRVERRRREIAAARAEIGAAEADAGYERGRR